MYVLYIHTHIHTILFHMSIHKEMHWACECHLSEMFWWEKHENHLPTVSPPTSLAKCWNHKRHKCGRLCQRCLWEVSRRQATGHSSSPKRSSLNSPEFLDFYFLATSHGVWDLIPQQGIKSFPPSPPTLCIRSTGLNYCTTREVLKSLLIASLWLTDLKTKENLRCPGMR